MIAGLPWLVASDGVSPDQERALAAVMLGLVVFAAVFVLVERQRSRRAKQAGQDPGADGTEGAEGSGPPVAPVVPPAPVEPRAAQLYTPPLANPMGSVPDPMPPAPAPAPSLSELPDPAPRPATAPPAATPPEVSPEVPGTPASPDEIGIVLPDDQPPSSGEGPAPG